jgi:hypothetical protein
VSHDGTERIVLRRTPEDELDDAIERVRRRPWGRSGRRAREVCLQYDFGHGFSRSIFAETFDKLVPLRWVVDEEEGVRVLPAHEVRAARLGLRRVLRRPRTLGRAISALTEEDRWSADEVRSVLRKYRTDPDSSAAESEGERLLQVAAQLLVTLEQAAARGHAVVEASGER